MLLHTDAFTHKHFHTHRGFYTQTLLHTEACTHRSFYTQTLLHRRFSTQTLSHTETFTHTEAFTDAFTHRGTYTQKLLHRDSFTHRRFYTHTYTYAFTIFYAQKRTGGAGRFKIAILPQFFAIEPHFVRKGSPDLLQIAILPQFLAIEPHFVRKGFGTGPFANRNLTSVFGDRTSFRNLTPVFGDRTSFRAKGFCDRTFCKSQSYLSFWRSNLISCERVCRTFCLLPLFSAIELISCERVALEQVQIKIAILPQFLAIEPRYVRKGCVSCCLVGTAPRLQDLQERKRKEGESKRARGQERMWRCEDVKTWGCEDEKMWGC